MFCLLDITIKSAFLLHCDNSQQFALFLVFFTIITVRDVKLSFCALLLQEKHSLQLQFERFFKLKNNSDIIIALLVKLFVPNTL